MACGNVIKSIKMWDILKAATGILCMVCFVANSFYIFEQFIGRKTITSHDAKKYETLILPSVTICNFSSFKKLMSDSDDIELQNYLTQTIDLEEVLEDVGPVPENGLISEDPIIPEEMHNNAATWKRTTTYSPLNGRCYTIQYKKEVDRQYYSS